MEKIDGNKKKNVCVIGGGPFGLVSLRRVLESDKLTGTIFEHKDDVGGLWNFKGEKQFRTSPAILSEGSTQDYKEWTGMYTDLTANGPYKLLELQDFPHPTSLLNDPVNHTFRTQKQLHQYFRDYAEHFNLWSHIQLNTAVISVRPEENAELGLDGTPCRWLVTTHNHKDDVYNAELFDAVMVCTGRYNYPYMPSLPGLESFQGQVIHSKYFESAAEYANKDVVCVGLGAFSADIAIHLSETAKSITLCHKSPNGFKFGLLPANVREISNVKQVTSTGIMTECGEVVRCDVIILATGYTLKFPFFNNASEVPHVVDDKYVPHLYNMIVFSKRPSLAILNMCYRCAEGVLADIQALYFVSVLDGRHQLPSYPDMEHSLKFLVDKKTKPKQPYSLWLGEMGFGGWEYYRAITKEIGMEKECCRELPLLEALYLITFDRIFGKLLLSQRDKLRIVNENTWVVELCPEIEGPTEGEMKMAVLKMDPVTRKVKTEIVNLPQYDITF